MEYDSFEQYTMIVCLYAIPWNVRSNSLSKKRLEFETINTDIQFTVV